MSLWTGVVDAGLHVAADAAGSLPVTGSGTLAAQARIFGFGATTLGTQAEAASHNVDAGVALAAVAIGVALVALLPEVALAAATVPLVNAALPLLGGAISEAALGSIIGAVIEAGLAGIAESCAAGVLSGFLGLLGDYGWAAGHPSEV